MPVIKRHGSTWVGPHVTVELPDGSIYETIDQIIDKMHLVIPVTDMATVVLTLVPNQEELKKGSSYWLEYFSVVGETEIQVDGLEEAGEARLNPNEYRLPLSDGTVARIIVKIYARYADPIFHTKFEREDDPDEEFVITIDYVNLEKWVLVHQAQIRA